MSSKVNWPKWGQLPTFKLWEAVALSLDVEPTTVRNYGIMSIPASEFRESTPEFRDRAEILERIVNDDMAEACGLVLQRRFPAALASTITPSDFVRFAKARPWTIAAGLEEIAARSQQGDNPVAAGRWPWGAYKTEMLDHLAATVQKWWLNYDPGDPSTAPTNEEVVDWLKSERHLTQRKAEAIASVVRADNIPQGPRR